MATSIYYDIHVNEHITLGKHVSSAQVRSFELKGFLAPTERDIIGRSSVPIHVFFIVQQGIPNTDHWPQNRRQLSSTGKSTLGAFVTYQSDQEPLTALGIRGDLWLTKGQVFIKEEAGTWKSWIKKVEYTCPYSDSRKLGWSTAGHFKYLTEETFRKERRLWPIRGTYRVHYPLVMLIIRGRRNSNHDSTRS